MAPLLRSINRESYTAVFNAMFLGVVRRDAVLEECVTYGPSQTGCI